MSAKNQHDQQTARLVGHTARMKEPRTIENWVPPTEAEVDAMPLPARRPPRGWKLARPAAEELAGDARRQPTAQKMPEPVPPVAEPAAEKGVPAAPPARPERPRWIEAGSLQEMVWEHPENAAMLIRTMLMEEQSKERKRPVLQEVAILCVGLGQEVGAEVLKYLSDYEIEEITQAIAGLKNVSKELRMGILEEFKRHLQAGEWIVQGGVDFARAVLAGAVGARQAQEILERVTTRVSSGFYMLKNVAPDQIAPFISHEHPQTIALILSQLEPAQAAGILAQLPENMQPDVAYRMATMENITPAVIKQIEESLESSLRDILGGNRDVGGPKVVADVLNMAGSSVEKNVLDQLDAQDPEVAEAVRNLMFVFDDIAKLTDREIQTLLREVDQKDLVVALKAASEELKNKILSNLSEQVRTYITEEMEFLGPMRLAEVEEVQLRIVQQVRQLEEQGQLTIVRGADPDLFV